MTEPLDVVWQITTQFAAVIAWVKAIGAMVVATGLIMLPQPPRRTLDNPEGISPTEWLIVMWSRAGVLIGALNMMLSMVTSASALGPWGEAIFFPAMATNIACLMWCRRSLIWEHLKKQRSPEVTVVRALIAGKPPDLDKGPPSVAG